MNITIMEDDGKWQRRRPFSRCLALKIKGKQWSSPETLSGSRREEFKERPREVLP